MIQVTFIRHGQVPGNALKQYIGSTEQELSEEGIKQAKKLGRYYESLAGKYHYPIGKLYVSPMKRCIQTAEIVFPNKKYEIIDAFREMNFGDFEGKSYIDMEFDESYRKWVDSNCKTPIPNGDDPVSFIMRCRDEFNEIVERTADGEKICIVAHGGTIAAIVSGFVLPEQEFFDVFFDNCETQTYEYSNGRLYSRKNNEHFFQNVDCKYFPCHACGDVDEFNCMFCYCPLYYLGNECGGNCKITDNGIKSCIDCTIPHAKDSYKIIKERLKQS